MSSKSVKYLSTSVIIWSLLEFLEILYRLIQDVRRADDDHVGIKLVTIIWSITIWVELQMMYGAWKVQKFENENFNFKKTIFLMMMLNNFFVFLEKEQSFGSRYDLESYHTYAVHIFGCSRSTNN